MDWGFYARTLAALALLGGTGCEVPAGRGAGADPSLTLRTGVPVQMGNGIEIPWFELVAAEERLLEGSVGWFDDRNGDGLYQASEPYVPSHAASPAAPTGFWRSGRLRVPVTYGNPALLARATLESGAYLERVCQIAVDRSGD